MTRPWPDSGLKLKSPWGKSPIYSQYCSPGNTVTLRGREGDMVVSTYYMIGYQPYGIHDSQIFSPILRLNFTLLVLPIDAQNFYILTKANYLVFCLCFLCFWFSCVLCSEYDLTPKSSSWAGSCIPSVMMLRDGGTFMNETSWKTVGSQGSTFAPELRSALSLWSTSALFQHFLWEVTSVSGASLKFLLLPLLPCDLSVYACTRL